VKMDPRVKTPPDGLAKQHAIAMQSYEGLKAVHDTVEQVRKLRSQLRDLRGRAGKGALADSITALDTKAAQFEGAGGGSRAGGGAGRASGAPTLSRVNGELLGLMALVEGADVAPTTQAVAASEQVKRTLEQVLARWSEIKEKDIKTLNEQLVKAGLPALAY